jgi:uncharacterized membrane protein YbaN (DUF454 family)
VDKALQDSTPERTPGDSDRPAEAPLPTGARRIGWLVLGLVLVGIGIIGVFVPLLPTTDFMLLALPCFARSSPRLERWLVEHPVFGPPIRAWRKHRAIPRHAKIAACAGMALGFALFWWLVHPRGWVMMVVGGLLLSCALWIVRRPSGETP